MRNRAIGDRADRQYACRHEKYHPPVAAKYRSKANS